MSTLLLSLLALSMTTTATVHAREFPANASVECTGIIHQDGDSDQSQGDADKAVPHHHGTCHAQVANVPVSNALTLAHFAGELGTPIAADDTRPSSPGEPGLRPPSA